MTKRNKIIYWVLTIWLSFGMSFSAFIQLSGWEEEQKAMTRLGYPPYILTILGTWKILGVIAILIPKFPLLKEWAYAGFFFAMTGAACSHIASGDPVKEVFPALLSLALTIGSWYFRPADRKVVQFK